MPPGLVEQANIEPEEQAKVSKVMKRLSERTRTELAAAFAAAGHELPEGATLNDMLRATRTKLDAKEVESVQRRIARERAGEESTREMRTPTERIMRTLLDLGDTFETELAREIGDSRARELRVAGDGWDTRIVQTLACDQE